MNKVLTAVSRKGIFPFSLSNFHHRQMFQVEVCFFSSLCSHHRQNYQQISPVQSLSCRRQMSFLPNLKKKLSRFVSDATKVKVSSCLVYEKIADGIDYNEFIKCFEIPDTFQSWFLAIQLHVYITILIAIPEKHGKLFRNGILDCMWNDVELRIDRLCHIQSSEKRKYLKELVSQFNAALIAYDEGVFSDDTVLAAACWRTLFSCKHIDPELLENSVIYVRKQLFHLNSQNAENIIYRGNVSFLPLNTVFSGEKEM